MVWLLSKHAGAVALSKGAFSNFALGLYHWLSLALMGIILQLSAETVTAFSAMMQRAQGPQRQCVSVYDVPDAEPEEEAGNRRIKVKHWEERLRVLHHTTSMYMQLLPFAAFLRA